MTLQTFKAQTMAEALKQVKATMGADAVILHTRTIPMRRWLGLRRFDVVEITAGLGLKPRSQRGPVCPPAGDGILKPTQTYGPGGKLAAPTAMILKEPVKPFGESAPVVNAQFASLNKDICALTEYVKKVLTGQQHGRKPEVPEELFDHYQTLVDNEVADEIAEDIVRGLKRDLRPEYLVQDSFVRDKIIEAIDKLIPAGGPMARKQGPGPHVIALIGPTGVGKTTTLAKLGANLKLKDGFKVGMITLDTYRIAAVDQLKKYADIIGAPLRVVGNVEDLKEAVASMSNMDYVLIDTAGRSPKDAMKLNELRGLLASITPDEVHLVLSSTAGQSCVDLAVQKFSEVRVDRIIFTKLDEAAHVGVVLNVVRGVNKTLSYVTTGQDVPNDIEIGRGRLLARMILDGGSKRLGYTPVN